MARRKIEWDQQLQDDVLLVGISSAATVGFAAGAVGYAIARNPTGAAAFGIGAAELGALTYLAVDDLRRDLRARSQVVKFFSGDIQRR